MRIGAGEVAEEFKVRRYEVPCVEDRVVDFWRGVVVCCKLVVKYNRSVVFDREQSFSWKASHESIMLLLRTEQS